MTEQKDFWRDHDNVTPEFDQSEAVLSGPSRIIVGKRSTFTTIEEVSPGIYSAVKGNIPNTTGMKPEYAISILDPARVDIARLDFGISKLIYEIAFRYGGCKEFCEENLYSEKDVFQVLNADTPTFAQVIHNDVLISLKEFGTEKREDYGESDFALKVLEVARDLFQLIGTMNNFGIFHRNLIPEEIYIAFLRVKKPSSRPPTSSSTSTSSTSSTSTTPPPPAPPEVPVDDEFVERIALGDFEYSCSLIVRSIMNRLVRSISEFVEPNITQTCLLERLTQQPGGPTSQMVYDGPEGEWSDPRTRNANAVITILHNDPQRDDQLDKVRSDWGHYEAYSCAQVIEWLLNQIKGSIDKDLSEAVLNVRNILNRMRVSNLRFRLTLLQAAQQVDSILVEIKNNRNIAGAVAEKHLYPLRRNKRSFKMPSHRRPLRVRALIGGHFPEKK